MVFKQNGFRVESPAVSEKDARSVAFSLLRRLGDLNCKAIFLGKETAL